MNSNTDLTNFWISWHGTCSIRLCLKSQAKEVADLANEVMQSTNADFRNQLRHLGSTSGMRRSIYEDEAAQWGQNGDCGSAFELAESQLYAKATINKRAFKDYLFEEIAGRDGGMNKNLYGYMQRVIYSIAGRVLARMSINQSITKMARRWIHSRFHMMVRMKSVLRCPQPKWLKLRKSSSGLSGF